MERTGLTHRFAWGFVVILLILCACGQANNTTTSTTESPQQILSDAAQAFAKLNSFHLSVSAENVSLALDAHAGSEHGLQTYTGGSMTGITLEYIEVGTHVYFHGDAVLRVQGVADKYPQVGSNWFQATNANGAGGLDTFLDAAKTAHCLIDRHGTLTLGAQTRVDGTAATAVTAAAGGDGTTPETFYVANDGSHRLLRIRQTGPTVNGGSPGDSCENFGADPNGAGPEVTLDFTRFNQVDAIPPPTGALSIP